MEVKYIKSIVHEASSVPAVLDSVGVPFTAIDQANWPDAFPYKPDAQFRIAFNDISILLHYRVTEDSVRAIYGRDGGKVWTDSCVEFFCQPSSDGLYYNLESNCVGTVLLGCGAGRASREIASVATTQSIQRWASLGRSPFEERRGPVSWELALIFPFTAFFKHRLRNMTGLTVGANFYKCGDQLSQPHYLSWHPIALPKPDFHCPQFFGELHFEAPEPLSE